LAITDPEDQPLRALVVDDAEEFLRVVVQPLEREGFHVFTAMNGIQALEVARAQVPDIIILDIVLPKLDGLEVCRQLRGFSDAYVIMLTSRDDDVDKVIGLSVGADDYMTKPFSPDELLARIRSMLRRPRTTSATVLSTSRVFGDLAIDTDAREVSLRGQPVELTQLEFDILATLSSRPKVVFSRELLLDIVWDLRNDHGDGHIVDVHVSELRRKIGDDSKAPTYIRTVRGVGYKMLEG